MIPDTPCLFGLETEYGVSVFELGSESTPAPCMVCEALAAMLAAARATPSVPGYRAAGLFLTNGGRVYVETGLHLEYATPECPDPWTLATHVAAGERLILGWAAAAGDELGVTVRILGHNVDTFDPHVSWGCHENYLIRDRLDNDALREHLVPHLATRIIYTGAGGIACDGRLLLSPRATTIQTPDSYSTMHARGLVDLYRQEPWSIEGLRRLHLCCGDTNRLQTPNALKVGTTALILILLQNGIEPNAGLRLETPIEALWDTNEDPLLRAPLATPTGFCNALNIQRGLLGLCEQHIGARFMPQWSGRLCSLWRSALDRLSAGTAAGLLDWPTKRALFTRHGLERTTSPEPPLIQQKLALNVRLSMPGGILDQLHASRGVEPAVPEHEVDHATRLAPSGRASVRGKAIARCAPHGLANWSQVIDLARVRTTHLKNPISPSLRWVSLSPTTLAERYEGNAARIARVDFGEGNCRAVGLQFDGDLATVPEKLLEILFRASSESGDFPRASEVLRCIEAKKDPPAFAPDLSLHLQCHAGLIPDPEAIVAYGRASALETSRPSESRAEISYLGGRAFLGLGMLDRARDLLMAARQTCQSLSDFAGIGIRAAAHLGDTFRRLGNREIALKNLMSAESSGRGLNKPLHLADHVLPNLAKVYAHLPEMAAPHLREAAGIQCRLDHPFGLARTLLLQARIGGHAESRVVAATAERQLRAIQRRVPALRACPRLRLILDQWGLWCSGQPHPEFEDHFWGI